MPEHRSSAKRQSDPSAHEDTAARLQSGILIYLLTIYIHCNARIDYVSEHQSDCVPEHQSDWLPLSLLMRKGKACEAAFAGTAMCCRTALQNARKVLKRTSSSTKQLVNLKLVPVVAHKLLPYRAHALLLLTPGLRCIRRAGRAARRMGGRRYLYCAVERFV